MNTKSTVDHPHPHDSSFTNWRRPERTRWLPQLRPSSLKRRPVGHLRFRLRYQIERRRRDRQMTHPTPNSALAAAILCGKRPTDYTCVPGPIRPINTSVNGDERLETCKREPAHACASGLTCAVTNVCLRVRTTSRVVRWSLNPCRPSGV